MTFVRVAFNPDFSLPVVQRTAERPLTKRWYVEAGLYVPRAHSPKLLLSDSDIQGGVAFSLSSLTALDTELSAMTMDYLAAEGCEMSALARLALHEVIQNSVVHGNFGVGSGPARVWSDLSIRQQHIKLALSDPIRARRPITVAAGWDLQDVMIVVADEGCGYILHPPKGEQPLALLRGAGRGLIIARAAAEVSVARQGRSTRLKFKRCASASEAN